MFHSQPQKHTNDACQFGIGVLRERRREHYEEAREDGVSPDRAGRNMGWVLGLEGCAKGVNYKDRGGCGFGR